ncbi:hypothetical protein [Microvirga puerhi]|uniref:Transmembrane protein n=1 Tax=Microvirga puerhi TaxID=2876078 RepID=A0ABS7VNK6_9HYPH|nr:hypothetical protein [Microvirga puerhi]MBZ6077119.1 hypothetical protein [Microvirga puerhi]
MKTLVVALSTALIAVSAFSGSAEARPGRGHAYGHYKQHGWHASRGYYAAPRYSYRRSNNAAIAAGVTGAIIGGALGAATQPAYRRPYYSPYYEAPRRYYREDYYYGY